MISGIGVDVVDIARFERAITRTPRLIERLFAPGERGLNPRSLAGRFAAKEALIKALGGSDGISWVEVELISGSGGRPFFQFSGGSARALDAAGITRVHVSISHDAGIATAFVVAE